MAYFLFKLAYENDRRYGVEKIDKFDNFEEFLPITDVWKQKRKRIIQGFNPFSFCLLYKDQEES